MATKAPQKPAAPAAPAAPSGEAAGQSAKDLAATKRQKKREVDRRCQREARQRTKARIAYLEELVEELRQQDTSGQVASLMQQVSEARNERDLFARTLRGIEDSIRGHRVVLEDAGAAGHAGAAEDGMSVLPDSPYRAAQAMPPSLTPLDAMAFDNSAAKTAAYALDPSSAAHMAPAGAYALQITEAPIHRELVLAAPDGPCPYCDAIEASDATGDARPQSLWRFANTVMDAKPVLSSQLLQWEDDCSEDMPIRAIVEGWDAAEKRLGGSLPPLWRSLRKIDEGMFSGMQQTERLAIMRLMHWLYRYHADSSSQKAKIPPWYLARPSQSIEHAYAIDFFCWPGVRERFIFSEHSYCTDLFWHLVNKSLRILWQYDFRDCYTLNRHTGVYRMSRAFEQRISDINAWTMGPAFFRQWPELYADIPSYEAAALSMDRINGGGMVGTAARSSNATRLVARGDSMRMITSSHQHTVHNGEDVTDLDGANIDGRLNNGNIDTALTNGAIDGAEDESDESAGRQTHLPAHPNHFPPDRTQPQMAAMAEMARMRGVGVELITAQDWMWLGDMQGMDGQ